MSRPRRPLAFADLRAPTPLVPRVPARSAPLWTRPLGYGLMTLIWLLLFVIAAVAMLAALPLGLSSSPDGSALILFQRPDWPATLAVIALVAAPVLGVITVLVLCTTVAMTLSAATLFARSLRPRYADEKLSFSLWTRGETVGPISTALTGTTMSLLPIRMTRWSKVVTMIRFTGWIPNLSMFLMGTVWGIGYMWTVAWLLWPAKGGAAIACAAVSVVAGAALLTIIWRRRHQFARVMPGGWENSPYARSWPLTPETERLAEQRARRRRSRQRARRQRARQDR